MGRKGARVCLSAKSSTQSSDLAVKVALLGAAASAWALTPAAAHAERQYNLQDPVTPIATQIFDLHT